MKTIKNEEWEIRCGIEQRCLGSWYFEMKNIFETHVEYI